MNIEHPYGWPPQSGSIESPKSKIEHCPGIAWRLCYGTLLALIVLLAGCHQGQDPPRKAADSPPPAGPHPLFRDMAVASGLHFRLGHTDLSQVNILESVGHGCAFLDYDGDGWLDILLVGNTGARLYRNQGDGTFADVTDHALPKPPANAHFLGCAVADYDGDGRPDIFLTGYGCTALYHNEGNGTFRDVTAGSGLEARGPYDWTTSAAWADIDGDGRLDLYVCRYLRLTPDSRQLCAYKALDGSSVMTACRPSTYASEQGSLYHNEGNGHFRDITREAGLAETHGNGLGCLFCDFNGDGKPDLYIANDARQADLYLNLGHGHFRNIAVESGTAFGADGIAMSGMGMDWGDYDNDGRFDLLVANFAGQPKSLFHNEGKNFFVNNTYQSGLGAASLRPLTFGAAFVDVDNDGLLDIVFTNGHVQSLVEQIDNTTSYAQSTQLFHNLGGGRFADASTEAGPDFLRKIVGRGIAIGDYDGDGRPDLLIVDDEGAPLLLHNEDASGNHWLTLRCLRAPHGPDAIGARVTLTTAGRQQIAEVRTGGSYLSTNALEVHFGLGRATQADTITIRWPDGRTTTQHSIPADRRYQITPSDAKPTPQP